jgi:hypothetical protein
MQSPISRAILPNKRRRLKARRITRNSSELVLPEPPQRGRAVLNTGKIGCWAGGERGFFFAGEGVIGFCEAGADEKDVARASADLVLLEYGFYIREGDGGGFEGG